MIRTLAWKEYREQRALWLAIAILAALFTLYFGLLAKGGIGAAHDDKFVREIVIGGLFSLMVAQGVVCGAQLFAGEKEPRTLAFLEVLARQRASLWRTKLLMGGLLTLAQALLLVGLLLLLQLGWGYFPLLVGVGLLALFWGMLGGAVCEQVFPAILFGVVLAAGSLAFVFVLPVPREVTLLIVALVPLVLSRHSFCASDRDRRLRQHELQRSRQRSRGPHSWQTLVWLAEKQGRWIIWPGLLVSFLAGFVMYPAPDLLWSAVTLVIGLVCGHAVLGPEQTSAQESFLGAQRYPPGRVWLIKTVFWALAAAGMTALLYRAMVLRRDYLGFSHQETPLFEGIFYPNVTKWLVLTRWMIYGFCLGQFCGLLSRRVVVAGVLSVGTSLLLLAIWVPSLIMRGVEPWQFLAVPLFLLLAARLSTWAWFSGRLFTRRHFLGLLGCGLGTFFWLGANLWNRAVDIPDVGEPFDLRAFETRLTRAARSEAPLRMRLGILGMREHRNEVRAKLGPPAELFFPVEGDGKPSLPLRFGDYISACGYVLKYGWPKQDREFGRWLDAMFVGRWADDIRAAGKMPLGLIADPRKVRFILEHSNPDDARWILPEDINPWEIGRLFRVRALQLQARGDYGAALDQFATLLGISRQLRHCAPASVAWEGALIEWYALRDLDNWLHTVGPQPDSLRAALAMLRHHEEESPNPVDAIKADYYVTRNYGPSLYQSHSKIAELAIQLALDTPWEKERHSRLLNAYFKGQLRLANLLRQNGKTLEKMLPDFYQEGAGLRLLDTGWTREQWSQLQCRPIRWTSVEVYGALRDLSHTRARQVYIALMLFQIDKGHAPRKLDDLVPGYLRSLPLDTWFKRPFDYKVSQGEEVWGCFSTGDNPHTERLRPGQGVLCLEQIPMYWGAAGRLDEGDAWYFPVPLWTKK